jgi:hypothetical protein
MVLDTVFGTVRFEKANHEALKLNQSRNYLSSPWGHGSRCTDLAASAVGRSNGSCGGVGGGSSSGGALRRREVVVKIRGGMSH